jgi:hypothetical protein
MTPYTHSRHYRLQGPPRRWPIRLDEVDEHGRVKWVVRFERRLGRPATEVELDHERRRLSRHRQTFHARTR